MKFERLDEKYELSDSDYLLCRDAYKERRIKVENAKKSLPIYTGEQVKGFYYVDTFAALAEIPEKIRSKGMFVYVIDEDSTYQLSEDLLTFRPFPPIATKERCGIAKPGDGLGINREGELYTDNPAVEAMTNMEIESICQ